MRHLRSNFGFFNPGKNNNSDYYKTQSINCQWPSTVVHLKFPFIHILSLIATIIMNIKFN